MENNTVKSAGMTFGEEMDKVSYGVVDAGDYEVTLKAERKYTKDGSKTFLNCDFKIRDDVEQAFKGRHVFDAIWKDKNNDLWFDLVKLNKIIKTQVNPKINFDDVDECIQYINGLNMIITVEKNFDDYTGQERNSVKYLSYRKSVAVPTTSASANDNIPTDDLPF